ncbi:MAG TPA: hypothetical protein PK559_12945 [Ignavibacteriaceae bacterium]|nr:hypothetical protein [Ignavibacteriaceae bacterium]
MKRSSPRTVQQAINRLNDLTIGLQKYSDDPELTAAIPSKSVSDLRDALSNLNYEYKQTRNLARIQYKELRKNYLQTLKFLAAKERMARAIYGPEDQRLADLGMHPYKTTNRKRKPSEPTSPEPTE